MKDELGGGEVVGSDRDLLFVGAGHPCVAQQPLQVPLQVPVLHLHLAPVLQGPSSAKGGKGAAARPHSYTRKYVANVLGWKSRYVEQSQVWQVASRLDDAETWEPARTKVRETKVRRVLPDGRITFEDKQPEPVRIAVREVPDRDPAVRWHDAPTPVSFEVPGFRERVERARKNLDDFSNGDPLRPGKRKAIVRWYDS